VQLLVVDKWLHVLMVLEMVSIYMAMVSRTRYLLDCLQEMFT